MKVVILAGGKGTRISEESVLKPKPMVEIGGKPILWHIMKQYSYYSFNEFIICCGYKGYMIKDYFIHYYMHQSNSSFHLKEDKVTIHESYAEPWKITLANTGLETLTAGRILKINKYLQGEEEFMLTYGDGVSDVNIKELLSFHHEHGKLVTITTTQPVGRFGGVEIDKKTNTIYSFKEKIREDQSWVNAGFMVLNKKIFEYLGEGNEMMESGPLERIAAMGEMVGYRHKGFWSPMDTLRDKNYLESLWNKKKAPWKIWN